VILVAYGLSRIATGRVLVAIVLIAVVLGGRGIANWYRAPVYENYRAATTEISSHLRAGDAVIFSPDEVRIPAEFYLRDDTERLGLVPVFPREPWRHFKTGDQKVVDFGSRTIDLADPARYPRIWLVAFGVDTQLKHRIAELRLRYRLVSRHRYRGAVEVLLLQAPPS
jgi:hypothetical protein